MVGPEIVRKYASSEYGYSSSEFKLETFRLMAFVSAFGHQAQMELPKSWEGLVSSVNKLLYPGRWTWPTARLHGCLQSPGRMGCR